MTVQRLAIEYQRVKTGVGDFGGAPGGWLPAPNFGVGLLRVSDFARSETIGDLCVRSCARVTSKGGSRIGEAAGSDILPSFDYRVNEYRSAELTPVIRSAGYTGRQR